jgi:hypothetical protein
MSNWISGYQQLKPSPEIPFFNPLSGLNLANICDMSCQLKFQSNRNLEQVHFTRQQASIDTSKSGNPQKGPRGNCSFPSMILIAFVVYRFQY